MHQFLKTFDEWYNDRFAELDARNINRVSFINQKNSKKPSFFIRLESDKGLGELTFWLSGEADMLIANLESYEMVVQISGVYKTADEIVDLLNTFALHTEHGI